MDKYTLFECLKKIDDKYQLHLNEALRLSKIKSEEEKEYTKAVVALKELKDEIFDLWYNCD